MPSYGKQPCKFTDKNEEKYHMYHDSSICHVIFTQGIIRDYVISSFLCDAKAKISLWQIFS
jgi:hypothetical protein